MAILSPVFTDPNKWTFDRSELAVWLGSYVVISALSYVLNFTLQKVAGPGVFSQIGYWGTGFGILLAAALFSDVLTVLSLAGLAIIIFGGVLANRRRT